MKRARAAIVEAINREGPLSSEDVDKILRPLLARAQLADLGRLGYLKRQHLPKDLDAESVTQTP